MRQMEQLPLGASATSIVVCTTLRAALPSGDVASRVDALKPWPAARDSDDSCGDEGHGRRERAGRAGLLGQCEEGLLADGAAPPVARPLPLAPLPTPLGHPHPHPAPTLTGW
jgi:hypothetical protein